MDWHTATIEELSVLQRCALNNNFSANNYSAVNTILYSQKYRALISIEKGWFFEKYCDDEKSIFSFPHNLDGDKSNIKAAIEELAKSAKQEKNANTCVFKNITAEEKEILKSFFEVVKVEATPAYSDYIYLTENLSTLPGAKYSKKRNHLNQFKKKHTDFKFELLGEHNIKQVYEIEEKWLLENTQENQSEKTSDAQNNRNNDSQDLQAEEQIIKNALDNFDYFSKHAEMKGGILFVKEEPVAFCLSSRLSDSVIDIHFEKCLSPFAKDGGYAVINNEFAKTILTKYINREEDLGIEGLRKAKRSYYPEILLEKFDVEIKI